MATKPKTPAAEPTKSLAERRKDRAKAEQEERQRERGYGRYLKRKDGKIFNYTKTLAARPDMIECDADGQRVLAKGIEDADGGQE